MSGRLVLVRHGQSLSNVERRLDTRPPGRALTDLGRSQAREFARGLRQPPAMIAHSIAVRAVQTATEIAAEIAGHVGQSTHEFDGVHEVQVGELEDRNDDAAIAEFESVYQRWHEGDLGAVLPGGESGDDVLDRYVAVVTQLRLRYLDDDAWHGDIVLVSHGAAIRLVSAVLAGVDGGFALEHHLANTESVVLSPVTDGRWSCLQWGTHTPPFRPVTDVDPVQDALESADPMG